MFFGSRQGRKGPKVSALPGLGILLARIQPVFAGPQFSNHGEKMAADSLHGWSQFHPVTTDRRAGTKLVGT
jgi:hypothetical protein